MTSSMKHCEKNVAMPEPKTPHAGKPQWPKIKSQLPKALKPIAKRPANNVGPGRFSAAKTERRAKNRKFGAIAHSRPCRYVPAKAASSGCSPTAVKMLCAFHSTAHTGSARMNEVKKV